MLMLTALRFSATAGREAERVEKKLKRGGKSGKWAERVGSGQKEDGQRNGKDGNGRKEGRKRI